MGSKEGGAIPINFISMGALLMRSSLHLTTASTRTGLPVANAEGKPSGYAGR